MFGMSVPMSLPFKVALKTGTTKAYTDLWAIGTTREYTVGVWAGNFDGEPTDRVRSVQGATPLVRAAYSAIAARFGRPTIPRRPPNIVSAAICPLSGSLPGPHCEHRKEELFVAGRLPREKCTWHRQICGRRAVIYPREVRSWVGFFERQETRGCEPIHQDGAPRIVEPLDGARYILEPHRPASLQRPPLRALPDHAEIKWSINGQAPEKWIPTPGSHEVTAFTGGLSDSVTVVYSQ